MGYEIVVQDFALPFRMGADYLPDVNLYSDNIEGNRIEIQENPHELFEGMGMGRISTNKSEYETEPVEFYQDTISETEGYVLEETEEEEVRIVSWEKEETEEILRGLEENAASVEFPREGAAIKEPADEDVF
jgi:hypothetical protein